MSNNSVNLYDPRTAPQFNTAVEDFSECRVYVLTEKMQDGVLPVGGLLLRSSVVLVEFYAIKTVGMMKRKKPCALSSSALRPPF